MELLALKATPRTATGNGPSRVLRRQGRLPAVLYGPGSEPMLVTINTHEFELVMKSSAGSQAFINLQVDGESSSTHRVMVKELQSHPVSQFPLHVDFYKISMDRQIKVNVAVSVVGTAKGAETGGMLQVIRREVELQCLPGQIPDSIELDVSELDTGDSIHADDIPLPEGVEIVSDVNFTVVTVLAPKGADDDEVEGEEGDEDEEAAETVEAEGSED